MNTIIYVVLQKESGRVISAHDTRSAAVTASVSYAAETGLHYDVQSVSFCGKNS